MAASGSGSWVFVAAGILAAVAPFPLLAGQSGGAAGTMFVLGCGDFRGVDLGHIDYRLRSSSPDVAKGVKDLDNYHTTPARNELMKARPHAQTVVSNLDFSLRHSPNHHEALRLLVKYELDGGNLAGYPSSRCYLDWAHRYAPDDPTVLQYGGIYFWKKGDVPRAEAWFLKSLEFQPDSADANYNLGLMYFDQKDMEKARKYARQAYAAGFPLPGLRDKLARAGYPITLAPEPAGSVRP